MKRKSVLFTMVILMIAMAFSACSGSKTPIAQPYLQEQLTSSEYAVPQERAVGAPDIKSVQLSRSHLTLREGEQDLLCLAVLPVDASRDGLVWSVEDEKIASVHDGLVTALRCGTTAVHVRSSDGRFDLSCPVTVVSEQEQECLEIEPLADTQRAVKDAQIVITAACGDIFPLAVAHEVLQGVEVLSYESLDENVILVDSYGLVYALCPGSAVVCVHTAESVIELLFEVEQEQIMLTEELPEQKCVVAGSRFSVMEGQPFEKDTALTICSSNGEVAAVDGMDIVALAKGSAQILVYQGDELIYELFLTVTQ